MKILKIAVIVSLALVFCVSCASIRDQRSDWKMQNTESPKIARGTEVEISTPDPDKAPGLLEKAKNEEDPWLALKYLAEAVDANGALSDDHGVKDLYEDLLRKAGISAPREEVQK